MKSSYLYIAMALLGMQSCSDVVTDDEPQTRSTQLQYASQLGARLVDGLYQSWNSNDAISLLSTGNVTTTQAQSQGIITDFANP